MWWAALTVTLCGIAATAHGLYAVVHACGVLAVIAGLYVPITDGLALVAYAATDRLRGGARGYAWTVVIVAAGLSGLAQAVNLAGLGEPDHRLKFGVGYWPAVAVAVAAHLLWLVGHAHDRGLSEGSVGGEPAGSVSPGEPVAGGLSEPTVVGASEPGEPGEPATDHGLTDPAGQAHEPEPASCPEPTGEPMSAGPVSPPEPPPEPRPVRRLSPRPTRAQAPAGGAQVDCTCGLDKCAGRVSKSTRTRHRDEVAKALELAFRVGQNGHHDPASRG